jgi:hypothetical protein
MKKTTNNGSSKYKESNDLIQWMEAEIRKKINCVSQYDTLAEKLVVRVNRKAILFSFVDSGVCHFVCIAVSCE